MSPELETFAGTVIRGLSPVSFPGFFWFLHARFFHASRGKRQFPSKEERLAFGERVSAFLVRIVQDLPPDIGFLISIGGITSNDTLNKGLALSTARVLAQVRAGCSVVRCPADHSRFPDLPVVIFPGNVGGEEASAEVYRILSRLSQELPAGQWEAA